MDEKEVKVINASGKMTALGVSRVKPRVVEEINKAFDNFYIMDDLFEQSNRKIANMLNTQGCCITNSASSGISLAAASLVCKDDLTKIINYNPSLSYFENEILILKTHNINYGVKIETIVNLGGVKLVEVGSEKVTTINDFKKAISQKTRGILYVSSHYCNNLNQVNLSELVIFCQKYNLPLIVDAAAEEDLFKFTKLGANLVIYSGTKAVEGPNSGFVIGDKHLTDNIYLQYKGIGRAMKINKEGIVGLTIAIKEYLKNPINYQKLAEKCHEFKNQIIVNDQINIKLTEDKSRKELRRVQILFDNFEQANQFMKYLANGKNKIITRNYLIKQGIIEFDLRNVTMNELTIIVQKINKRLKGVNNEK